MSLTVDYWIDRYTKLVKGRERLWRELKNPSIENKWIITRITEHQWSIDEVLRHILGSEIRYVQQPIESTIKQNENMVPAQWIDKVFFRFEEKEHMNLDTIIDIYNSTQDISNKILLGISDKDLLKEVEAPWRQMVSYNSLLHSFYDHEISHMGQIYFMLTYFRGPPKFESNWENNK